MRNMFLLLLMTLATVAPAQQVDTYVVVYDGVRSNVPEIAGATYVDVSVRDDYKNPFWQWANSSLARVYGYDQKYPILRYPVGSVVSLHDGISGSSIQEIEAKRAQQPPIVYTAPIEAPQLIVVSETNAYGVGITADDDGNLITFRAHSSPYDPLTAKSNRTAAIQKAKTNRAKAKSEVNGQLQQRVENLERLLKLRE